MPVYDLPPPLIDQSNARAASGSTMMIEDDLLTDDNLAGGIESQRRWCALRNFLGQVKEGDSTRWQF